jgi:hypothetical protein
VVSISCCITNRRRRKLYIIVISMKIEKNNNYQKLAITYPMTMNSDLSP